VVAAVRSETLCRPVCSRAIRIAFSFASAPPLVKKTRFAGQGPAADQPGGLAARIVGEGGAIVVMRAA